MRFPIIIKFLVVSFIFIIISSGLSSIVFGELTEAERTETDQAQETATYAETMVIKGQVIDGITEMGIPHAVVYFHNDEMKYRVETQEGGLFAIELPAGKFKIIVEARGYNEFYEEIAGRPDQVIEVLYSLMPADENEVPPDGQPPPPPPDEKQPPTNEPVPEDDFKYDELSRENVIKDGFGGGDSRVFHNGQSGAKIVILFGTREEPNTISIVAYYNRYVGAGDLYDENGVLIGKNEPIIYKTIFKQTFTQLLEYNDTNGDGLRNIPEFETDNLKLDRPYLRFEPVYKVVSLKTAWEPSRIRETTYRNSMMEYSFDLTARNLPYTIFGEPDKIATRGSLDLVKFTFHIYLKKDDVTRDDIPVFRVDVRTEDNEVREYRDIKFDENRSYKGSRISSRVKYDYSIGGWDYDPVNKNPRLFLEMYISFLHAPHSRLAQWMTKYAMNERDRFNEKLKYSDQNGYDKEMYVEHNENEDKYELVENSNEPVEKTDTNTRGEELDSSEPDTTSETEELTLKNFELPEQVNNNQLDFSDSLYRAGSFSWINNLSADGRGALVKFQILRVGWLSKFIDGKWYSGMQITGGFNLPAAKRIHHDPTFTNEIFQLQIEAEEVEGRPVETNVNIFSMILLVIIIVVVLIAFYGMVNTALDRKMKPPKIPRDLPPPPAPKTVINKDKFKSKKPEQDEYYESYYVDWDD